VVKHLAVEASEGEEVVMKTVVEISLVVVAMSTMTIPQETKRCCRTQTGKSFHMMTFSE
jgi:hypothetical protein